MRIGIVGPSYQSQSLLADAQKCQNWYVEQIESGTGKSKSALYQRPGYKAFCTPTGYGLDGYGGGGYGIGVNANRCVGSLACFNRLFKVMEWDREQNLIEIFSDGTFISRGALGPVGKRASLAYNNANQMLVASGGRVFLLNLKTDALSEIDSTSGNALQGPVSKVKFNDSFFIALLDGTNKWQISAPLDGSSWDPTDITAIEVFPDNILAMEVDHREIVIMGAKQSVVYGDSGAPQFPFDVLPGGFVEQGILAPDSLTKLDNSLFWIGADERGGAMGWRAVGYQPQRITNHSIEFAWQGYSQVDDAVAYAFQYRGHTFWHVSFPTAHKSWRYDVATGLWAELTYFDGTEDLSNCHSYAFGKHLVGSGKNGKIYEMGNFNDDDGAPMMRLRRAPNVGDEDEYSFHQELRLSIETGLGPANPLLDGQGNPRDPDITLRWSDDGAKTWSQPHIAGLGQGGEFNKRVVFRRLGRSRHRIYEISVSDPIPVNVIDAYLSINSAQAVGA